MFLADEIEKFLVCENCFEQYNEINRIPLSIFPCGHSYCQACINGLASKKCPECKCEFELTAKNWSLINLIPKPKIAENFAPVRELVDMTIGLLKQFQALNEEKNQECTGLIDNIRSEVNAKADELINRIKQSQASLCDQLNAFEHEWKKNYAEYSSFQQNLDTTLKDTDIQLSMEDVKTSETTLDRIKSDTEKNLNDLNAFKLKCTSKSDDVQLLHFKKSHLFNTSADEMFSESNLFGELVFNNKASINNSNSKTTNATNDTTTTTTTSNKNNATKQQINAPILQKLYEFETYSEIETIVKNYFHQVKIKLIFEEKKLFSGFIL